MKIKDSHVHSIFSVWIIFIPLMLASPAVGQWDKNESGMFETQDEYHAFIGSAKEASAANPELRAMIPLLNDIALGREIGSTAKQFSAQSSDLGLIRDSKIRQDIEMMDDQYEDIKNRQSEIQQRLAREIREIDFSNSDNVIDKIRKVQDAAQKDLESVLLPHQVKRLKQIRMQTLLLRHGLVEVITNDPIKSDLDVTQAQADELKEFEKVVEADLQKEIERLREKARDRLLSKIE